MTTIDDLFLDRIFQPIGNWSHSRLGIHPQTIAEFFGMGAVLAELGAQIVDNLPLSRIGPVDVIASCAEVAIPLIWYAVIRRPIRIVGGRNPKRYYFALIRTVFIFSTLAFIAELPMVKHVLMHGLFTCSTLFIWIGMSFAALDEPPPRQYRIDLGIGVLR